MGSAPSTQSHADADTTSPPPPSDEFSLPREGNNKGAADKIPPPNFLRPASLLAAAVSKSLSDLDDDERLRRKASDLASSALLDDGLYRTLVDAARYQRDAYLTGSAYADERARRRDMADRLRRDLGSCVEIPPLPPVPLDLGRSRGREQGREEGVRGDDNGGGLPLGEEHLVALGKAYIPSQYSVDALRPTVVWLPGRDGPLSEPVRRAAIDLIPMNQLTLDWIVKSNVLWFLDDEDWRRYIKESTGGYVTSQAGREKIEDRSRK